MIEIVILVALYVVISMCLYDSLVNLKRWKERKSLKTCSKALFVTAHPDDECMFFAPTIIQLCKRGCRVYLLCLSNGNHCKEGRQRKLELYVSCKLLGINKGDITLVTHTNLPDDPNIMWHKNIVAGIVEKHISTLDVDTLVTFDGRGVSGHLNHRAIYEGVKHLVSHKRLPPACRVYTLTTVNVLRKYSHILDVPLSYMMSETVHIASSDEINTGKDAMAAHQSQLVWFRKLYIMASRYMIINTFQSLQCENESNDASKLVNHK